MFRLSPASGRWLPAGPAGWRKQRHRRPCRSTSRRGADPSTSYTAKLFAKGPDSILKKIGEECAELIMAAKDGKRQDIVYESADVLYHVLALLAFYGIGAEELLNELQRREGTSGIAEKNSRTAK